MEFCNFCDNMFYINTKIVKNDENDEVELVHYLCKFCGNEEPFKQDVPKLISKTSFKTDDDIDKWVKKDILHDVTLPHVTNIKCSNKSCSKKSEEDNDIILLRYNHTDVKFIYYCVHCQKYWKND